LQNSFLGLRYVDDLFCFFFFSSRRRHTSFSRDWSSDVCLPISVDPLLAEAARLEHELAADMAEEPRTAEPESQEEREAERAPEQIGRASCRERGGAEVGGGGVRKEGGGWGERSVCRYAE